MRASAGHATLRADAEDGAEAAAGQDGHEGREGHQMAPLLLGSCRVERVQAGPGRRHGQSDRARPGQRAGRMPDGAFGQGHGGSADSQKESDPFQFSSSKSKLNYSSPTPRKKTHSHIDTEKNTSKTEILQSENRSVRKKCVIASK